MWEREGHFCPVIPCWPNSLYFWGAHKAEVGTLTPPKESLLFMLTFSITFAVKEVFCCDLLLLETKSKVAAMALLVFEETSNFPTLTHRHCHQADIYIFFILSSEVGRGWYGDRFSLRKLVAVSTSTTVSICGTLSIVLSQRGPRQSYQCCGNLCWISLVVWRQISNIFLFSLVN